MDKIYAGIEMFLECLGIGFVILCIGVFIRTIGNDVSIKEAIFGEN